MPQLYDRLRIVTLPNGNSGIVAHCNSAESSGHVVVIDQQLVNRDYFIYELSEVTATDQIAVLAEIAISDDEYTLNRRLLDYMLTHGTGDDIDNCLNWYRDHIGKTCDAKLGTMVRKVIDELLYDDADPRLMRDKMKQSRFFYELLVLENIDYMRARFPGSPRLLRGKVTKVSPEKKQKVDEET
jgi:hypothetical protein